MNRPRLISFDDEETIPLEDRCGTCRYFVESNVDRYKELRRLREENRREQAESISGDGKCHRYPPELTCYQDDWPETAANSLCGEWEGWQDEERTYTPNERQLDCRIDCQAAPGRARQEVMKSDRPM